MIEIKIKGGMGNQMCEYAMARKVSLETGIKEIGLELSSVEKDNLRDFSLGHFKLPENVYIVTQKNRAIRIQEKIRWHINIDLIAGRSYEISKRREEKLGRILGILGIIQRDYSKTKIFPYLRTHKNIVMNGWFQEEEALYSIRNILKNDFLWKECVKKENLMLMKKIEETESVCVHIRRGDYVNHPILGVCGENYYWKAMEAIKERIKNPVFFVFSDDIDDVKEHINLPYSVIYENRNDKDYEGLQLMVKCKHFIMSNSTYSWWAQFLAENEKKVVVAPDQWFVDKNRNSELYRKDWILIKAQE